MKTNNIVIVGGGSAGWMSAMTLLAAFPEKNITVIESPDYPCLLYTSPSPRDATLSRMPSSA